jgi:hypothetical protein
MALIPCIVLQYLLSTLTYCIYMSRPNYILIRFDHPLRPGLLYSFQSFAARRYLELHTIPPLGNFVGRRTPWKDLLCGDTEMSIFWKIKNILIFEGILLIVPKVFCFLFYLECDKPCISYYKDVKYSIIIVYLYSQSICK